MILHFLLDLCKTRASVFLFSMTPFCSNELASGLPYLSYKKEKLINPGWWLWTLRKEGGPGPNKAWGLRERQLPKSFICFFMPESITSWLTFHSRLRMVKNISHIFLHLQNGWVQISLVYWSRNGCLWPKVLFFLLFFLRPFFFSVISRATVFE